MRLSQNRFCKKFLGNSVFGDAVDPDIHEELKNELTTQIFDLQLPTNEKNKFVVKFEAKDRFCDSLIMHCHTK